MARETNCPDLCEKVKIRDVKGEGLTKAFDDKSFYDKLREKMFNAVQCMKGIEPYRKAASEIAEVIGGAVGGAAGARGGGKLQLLSLD